MVWLIALLFSSLITFLINIINKGSVLLIVIEFLLFFIVAVLLYILFMELCGLILIKKDEKVIKPKKIFKHLTLSMCKFACTLFGVKVIVKGKDKIDFSKRYLFVSNHQSNLDPVILIKAFPKLNLTFIMKKELMKIKIISRYLTAAGFYSLDRNNNREGLKTILTTIEAAKVRSIAVFPEGTRSRSGELLPFRDGIFKVSQKADCGIIVCSLDNTRNIKNRFPFRKTKVVIEVCDVISPELSREKTTVELGEIANKMIGESIIKNREEYKL